MAGRAGGRRGAVARRRALGAVAAVGLALGGLASAAFVAAAPPRGGRDRSEQRHGLARNFFSGFGAQTTSASGELAYDYWSAAYPKAAAEGVFLGDTTDKGTIVQRFDGLSQLFGDEIALDMVKKEPILLLYSVNGIRGSYGFIKGLESPGTEGQALQVVQQNPRCLTVPAFEYERTKPSLSGMMTSSSVINALRPLGPGGLAAFIFVAFVVLIVVLRPILYGVNGGPSVLSVLTGGLQSLPSPKDLAEENGISLAALVVLIPIANVLQIGKRKIEEQSDA